VVLLLAYDARTQWSAEQRFDLAWAYRFLGRSEAEAAGGAYRALSGIRWSARECGGACWPEGTAWLFSGPGAVAVGPRFLGQLVAAPFVAVLGPRGLLVPPVLCWAVATVLVVVLAARLWGRPWGLPAGALMLLPLSVSGWATAAAGDALGVALAAAALLTLPLVPLQRPRPGAYVLLLVLGLLTGPAALATATGVLLAWLLVAVRTRRLRSAWLPYAVAGTAAAAAVTALQWWLAAPPHLLLDRGFASLPETVRWVSLFTRRDVVADPVLAVVLALAVLALATRVRGDLAALALGGVLAGAAQALLAVSSSGVRDHLTAYPAVLLVAVGLLAGRPADRAPPPDDDTGGDRSRGGGPAPERLLSSGAP